MNLLLDTHSFLWYVRNTPQLSRRAVTIIAEADKIYFSAASYWEIILKYRSGKLKLEDEPTTYVSKHMAINSFLPININYDHLNCLATLPMHHRDPFDRILIAQAITEKLPIVSVNKQLKRYDVEVLW